MDNISESTTERESVSRTEIKQRLFQKGVGKDLSQAGTLLSNISQFLTKPKNSHLRQIIDFDSPKGEPGQIKRNYRIISQYRELICELLNEIKDENSN